MELLNGFNDLNLPPALKECLTGLGFLTPTPIQAQSIPSMVEGKDVLGIAPTGTGKTGAFGIPVIASLSTQKEKQALIVAPTRELAAQIFQFMRQLGQSMKLKGALLVGGESFRRQYVDWNVGVDFIVATPGRLMDHVNQGLDLAHIGVLILDEVDHMLDMGFAPVVEEIVQRVPKERQTLFFSATMPAQIRELASRYLKDPVKVTVGKNPLDAPKIKEERIRTPRAAKAAILLEQIKSREGKILIFARTQRGATLIADRLELSGIEAACLHGGRTQDERKRALDAFRRGRVRVLVATDIAARGIDVPDIEVVINYDYPATREDHLHRIGRTGRCGKEGIAITFLDDDRGGNSGGHGGGNRNSAPRSFSNNNNFRKPHFRSFPPEDTFDARKPRLGMQPKSPAPAPSFAASAPATARREMREPRRQHQAPPPPSRPPFKKHVKAAEHPGSVRVFRASDPVFSRRKETNDSPIAPVKPSTPDWIRSKTNTVRRQKRTPASL
jgi:superfamily II DNA/RNA helicase